MSSFTDVFTGNPIQVSPTLYRAFTFGVTTALSWPLNNEDNATITADLMEVTASAGSLLLKMPPANQVSNGKTCIIRNMGSNSFTVTDMSGTTITAIAAGQAFYVYVSDNSTANGVWHAFQYGSGSSAANAAALAGFGLVALATTLNLNNLIVTHATNYTILTSDRASTLIWTSGAGTFALSAAATLTAGWFCYVKNFGSGILTIDPNGVELIDGVATVQLSPNESCIIVCDGTGFQTLNRSANSSGSLNAYIATNGAPPTNLPSVNAAATSSMAIGSGAIVDVGGIGAIALGNSYVNAQGAISIAINNNLSAYGAHATYSVAIGLQNAVGASNAQGCAIGGDGNNAAGTGENSILAGESNSITGGTFNTIIAGVTNRITAGSKELIAGGQNNSISGGGSFDLIIAGDGNELSATGGNNTMIGTTSSTISGTSLSGYILAGDSHQLLGACIDSGCIGGEANTLDGCIDSVIVSGSACTMTNSSTSVMIGSVASDLNSGGGDGNVILGGSVHNVSGSSVSNTLTGDSITVSGDTTANFLTGYKHTLSDSAYCFVSGYNHTIASVGYIGAAGAGHSFVAGGDNSFLTGGEAKSATYGKIAHATGKFTAVGDAQTSFNVLKGSTVGAVTTELLINGAFRLVLPNDTTWLAWIHIVARRTDTDNFSAGFTRYVAIDRQTNAASTAIVAAVQTIGADFNDSTYSVAITADTVNGSLKISATGVALHTVQFVAFVRLVETTG